MESRNPALRHMEEQAVTDAQARSGQGAGFAYEEGRSAYSQATGTPPSNPSLSQAAQAAAANDATTEQLNELLAQPSRANLAPGGRMTLDAVVIKTGISFVVLVAFAVLGWNLAGGSLSWVPFASALAAFVVAMVVIFKKVASPPLILLYAALEGVFLGGISAWYYAYGAQNGNENLVLQAVGGTLVAFAVMLAVYKSRIIKVNGTFMKMFMVAMISYLVIALASVVASFFGVGGGWGFYGVGGLGILLCVVGVGLAAFSLVLDFDSIERAVQYGVPERESWRMAFGLMVTLVWLYLELLRLLAILSNNR